MKGIASYILVFFMTLLSVVQGLAQSAQPDVVGVGATKKYYVQATSGSSYEWRINGGAPEQSTTNSLEVNWTKAGIYTLTVQETTKYNCVGLIQSLQITVVDLPTSSTTNASICQGDSYTFNGSTYTTAGTYVKHLINAAGSDSAATLVLTVNQPQTQVLNRVICLSKLPYTWNGIVCSTPGNYEKHLVGINGCDSTIVLNLKAEDPIVTTFCQAICSSELPYTWNGIKCNRAGVYSAKFRSSGGCDSISQMDLKVNPVESAMKSVALCSGESYVVSSGEVLSTPGLHQVKLTTCTGCDSLLTLELKYYSGYNVSQAIRLFPGQSYSINGKTYDRAGVYTDVFKSKNSCDSVVTTELIYMQIPNTITPNGDGQNDVFMKGYRVKIYNRNGVMLYSGNDGWDGTYNGGPVSSDTYFYVLYFDGAVAMKPKEGYITVIR